MFRLEALKSEEISASFLPGLSEVISAVGGKDFQARFVDYLNKNCGAEHCALFRLRDEQPMEIMSMSLDGSDTAHKQIMLYLEGQYWKRDPSIIEAKRRVLQPVTSMLRLDIRDLQDNELRESIYGRKHILERVLLCGGVGTSKLGLSILSSQRTGPFSGQGLEYLRGVGSLLLSVMDKHTTMIGSRHSAAFALTSLPEIERCISIAPERFSRREREVISRILYGLSTAGIALDLVVAEETVMTYRKRAYHRLDIGTQRELLLWYLRLWSRLHDEGDLEMAAAPLSCDNVLDCIH